MEVRKFFKPKLKIIVTAILLFLPLILQFFFFTLIPSDASSYGFPLITQLVTYQCVIGGPCPEPHYVFNPVSLIFDLLILYFVTLLIIFIYQKIEKISKHNYSKSLLLALSLFVIFTIISLIFSIGYPFIKDMVGIGLPLIFYAYAPWTGSGIQLGSFFLWQYLIIDIICWYIISILIILVYNKFQSK